MAPGKKEDMARAGIYPRESEDPIAEDFREGLQKRPPSAFYDEERLARLESVVAALQSKVHDLEERAGGSRE